MNRANRISLALSLLIICWVLASPVFAQEVVFPLQKSKIITIPPAGVILDLVYIRPGRFDMGSSDEEDIADDDELPLHGVTIEYPLYVGKYEVTQAQWKAVMRKNPAYFPGDTRPVELVTWYDCVRFCNRLSRKLGYPECYNELTGECNLQSGGFRMPTEEEWEYICRAGTSTFYSFGDDEIRLLEFGYFDDNSGLMTHPVGSGKPNSWGIFDMHGNVYEWCQDEHQYYPEDGEENDDAEETFEEEEWDEEDSGRVIRGGGFGSFYYDCRSANRGYADPLGEYDDTGLRIVLPVLSLPEE